MPTSSPPLSSSQQSSLYRYYTPIPPNELLSTTTMSQSRVLQPSTQHNITQRSQSTIKRPLSKSTVPQPQKKPKLSNSHNERTVPQLSRNDRETFSQSLIHRGLTGQRGQLSQCISIAIKLTIVTCLYEAKHYFSRPTDMHHIQSEQGQGTYPFAVQCCNSTLPQVQN